MFAHNYFVNLRQHLPHNTNEGGLPKMGCGTLSASGWYHGVAINATLSRSSCAIRQ